MPKGKFTEEAGSAGPVLISRIVKLHYNWKYTFLRPTVKQIIERYDTKFCPAVAARKIAAAAAFTAAVSAAAAAASAAASSSAPSPP